jgi:hypothetical protein
VALDNGHLQYAGAQSGFLDSGISVGLTATDESEQPETAKTTTTIEQRSTTDAVLAEVAAAASNANTEAESGDDSRESTVASGSEPEVKTAQRKAPRKLIEEERRAVGRIARDIWVTYFVASGDWAFWSMFVLSLLLGAASPVLANGWLR